MVHLGSWSHILKPLPLVVARVYKHSTPNGKEKSHLFCFELVLNVATWSNVQSCGRFFLTNAHILTPLLLIVATFTIKGLPAFNTKWNGIVPPFLFRVGEECHGMVNLRCWCCTLKPLLLIVATFMIKDVPVFITKCDGTEPFCLVLNWF